MLAQIICVFVLLVHSNYAGNPPVMKVENQEDTCTNKDYIKSFVVSREPGGDKNIINVTLEVAEQISEDAMCEWTIYKEEDGEWQENFALPSMKCCEDIINSDTYKGLEKNQEKIPHSCPIEPGKYEIIKHELDDVDNDGLYGKYKSEFKMTSGDGDCLYGKKTELRICKPEGCL